MRLSFLSLVTLSMVLSSSAFADLKLIGSDALAAITSHPSFKKHFATHMQIATIHVGMYPVCEVCHSLEVVSYDKDGDYCTTNVNTIILSEDGTKVRDLPESAFHMTCKTF